MAGRVQGPAYVVLETGCWQWQWGRSGDGKYGRMTLPGQRQQDYAHRVYYEMAHGPIPPGMVIDHRCQNTLCVNPGHLRVATPAQNGQNRVGPQRRTASGIRGVYRRKSDGRWYAQAKLNRKVHRLGYFTTKEQAARAISDWRAENMPFSEADRPVARAS